MILKVRGHFDAAHKLVGYNGDCAKLHGHRWEVLATFQTDQIDDVGISVDFKSIKALLKACLPDHAFLNDLESLEGKNPTAEILVKVLAQSIQREVHLSKLVELELWESPDCSVVWRETE